MHTQRKYIPRLVKWLRRHLGLTQQQLAREIGVTFATVNSWENGKRSPLPFLVKRLMEIKDKLDATQRKGKGRR